MDTEFQKARDLAIPTPRLFWTALGSGSVFMSLSQGSGELIWWPYLVGKYGLAFVLLLLPACLLQYPVTYAICRYSVFTGESIFRGVFRFNKLLRLCCGSFSHFLSFGSAHTQRGEQPRSSNCCHHHLRRRNKTCISGPSLRWPSTLFFCFGVEAHTRS